MLLEEIRLEERYKLRYAAGLYWLLDMEQEGVPYKRPLAMNSVGAYIWQLLMKGDKQEDIAEKLSEEYQVDRETVLKDISCFLKQLEQYGFLRYGG